MTRAMLGLVATASLALATLSAPATRASPVPPVDAAEAARRLQELVRRPTARDAAARLLLLEPALDVLPPVEQASGWRALAEAEAPALEPHALVGAARFELGGGDRVARRLGLPREALVLGPVTPEPGGAAATLRAASVAASSGSGLRGWPVAWRHWSVLTGVGSLALDPLLPDGAPGAVHVAVALEVERSVAATVHIGGVASVAVSLNGGRPLVARGLTRARPDQAHAELTLARGTHVLLLTMHVDAVHGATSPALFVRIVPRRGPPLALRAATPEEARSAAAAVTASEPGHRSLRWARAIEPGRGQVVLAAAARRALGLPDPTGDGDGELLEDLLLTPWAASLPDADLVLALGAVRRDEARASVLSWLRVQGRAAAPLQVAAASVAASRGRVELARSQLAALDRDGPAVALELARTARHAGRPGESLRRVRALPPPHSERALVELARAADAMGLPDVALDARRALAEAAPGDRGHAAALADALVRAGFARDAARVLDALAARAPDRPAYALLAARRHAANEDPDAARRSVAFASALATVDVDVLAERARTWATVGAIERAEAAWRQVLALSPGDLDARAALELDRAADPAAGFAHRWGPELAGLPLRDPGADFEVLAEEAHVDLEPDGSHVRREQRILRAHAVPDDEEARTFAVRFDPGVEQVRILEASVIRDGRRIRAVARDVRDLTEAWYGLYYAQREVAVPFDDLRAGDVLVLRHEVRVAAPRGPLAGHFELLRPLRGRLHAHRVQLSVTAPASVTLDDALSREGDLAAGSVRRAQTVLDGRTRLELTARDVPPLPPEHGAVGLGERAPLWQVTTWRGWDDVATTYRRLVDGQRVVTPAMRRWVDARLEEARAGTGAPHRLRLARAIVEAVARDIRYVGLEFGVHGYLPYRTDAVWVRRFGDCKDQATLLTTLLGLAGVDAEVVLVRTRDRGRVPDPLPSLALFDHAIVHLPELGRYVDPTAAFYGLGELPPDDQGAQILRLVAVPPARLERTPVDPAQRNGVEGRFTISLGSDGGGQIDGRVRFRGVDAAAYRGRLVDEDLRRERLERLLGGRYPGLAVSRHEVSDPTRRGEPLRLEFTGRVPGVAQATDSGLEVERPAGGDGHATRLVRPDERIGGLRVGVPRVVDVGFRYLLPAGWEVDGLPPSATQARPFGAFDVRWRVEPGAVHVDNRLVLDADQVTAAEYASFREFVRAYDAATGHALRLRPKAEP